MAAVSRIDLPQEPEEIRLCSRCGDVSRPRPGLRVCDRCHTGFLLACGPGALAPGATAFVICRHDLTVSAVSEEGERIFGPEGRLIGSDLLHVATSPVGDEQLARHVRLAAARDAEPVELPVRLRGDDGEIGMLAARVASCGPPQAALVSVQRTGFGLRRAAP